MRKLLLFLFLLSFVNATIYCPENVVAHAGTSTYFNVSFDGWYGETTIYLELESDKLLINSNEHSNPEGFVGPWNGQKVIAEYYVNGYGAYIFDITETEVVPIKVSLSSYNAGFDVSEEAKTCYIAIAPKPNEPKISQSLGVLGVAILVVIILFISIKLGGRITKRRR